MRKGLSSDERELLNSPQTVHHRAADAPAHPTEADSVAGVTPDANQQLAPELSELHRTFAKSMSHTLDECVGAETEVALRHDGLSTFAQFVFGQPVPCCCAIVASETSQFEFYLAVTPSILYPMLDRLVGAREADPVPKRPMTEIERGLVEVLLAQVVAAYEEAWRPILSLSLNLARLEHNLQQSQLLSGGEATYRARYEVRFEGVGGFAEFCLPWEQSRPLRERLTHRD